MDKKYKIVCKPFDCKEIFSNGNDFIDIWCLENDTNKPILIKIKNFKPWCYLELPLKCSKEEAFVILNKLKERFNVNNIMFDGIFVERKKLYYYQSLKTPFLKLFFENSIQMSFFEKEIKKSFLKRYSSNRFFSGLPRLFLWEADKRIINNIRRFFSVCDLKLCEMIVFDDLISIEDYNKIFVDEQLQTYSCKSYIFDCNNFIEHFNLSSKTSTTEFLKNQSNRKSYIKKFIQKFDEKGSSSKTLLTLPKICSFDIETYSTNHNKFPDPLIESDVMYMITFVFQKLFDKSSRKRYLITLKNTLITPQDIFSHNENHNRFTEKDTKVLILDKEEDFYDILNKIFKEEDPDIIIGYNTHKFDYIYMFERFRKLLLKQFWPQQFSRNLEEPVSNMVREWHSNAYGYVKELYPKFQGRLSIDMRLYIENNLGVKLPMYNLNYVSNHFLGSKKDDVTAKQMFEYYKQSMNDFDNKILNDETTVYNMCKVGIYGLQDSELVIDLFEKLNTWLGLCELSSVAGITIESTFKGQQIRIMSLMYDICYQEKIVIDNRDLEKYYSLNYNKEEPLLSSSSSDNEEEKDKDKEEYDKNLKNGIIKFKGAHVEEPKPGKYINVIGLDFSSLYPSLIMNSNISYDTFYVKDSILEKKAFSGKLYNENKSIYKETSFRPKYRDSRYLNFEENCQKKHNISFYDTLEDTNKMDDEKKSKIPFYSFNFTKDYEGLLPKLVGRLIKSRKSIKKEMFKYEELAENEDSEEKKSEYSLQASILNQRQLAYKIIANSGYGFTSAQKAGKLPFVELSMAITATGRQYIKRVNDYVVNKYNGKIVYGDSVTEDTPILVKVNNECIKYIKIKDLTILFKNDKWINVPQKIGTNQFSKQVLENRSNDEIYIMSENGFTLIKNFIRHLYKNLIYKVFTKRGLVKCTSDHSLLNQNKKKISPKECILYKTKLLHVESLKDDNLKHLSLNNGFKTFKSYNDINSLINRLTEMFENKSNTISSDIILFKTKSVIQMCEVIYIIENFLTDYKVIEILNEKQISITKVNFFNKYTRNRTFIYDKYNVNNISLITQNDFIYVYDISTESETFNVGPGELVVHNTDSSMFILPDLIKTSKDCNRVGKQLAKEITAIFNSDAISLEFEKSMNMICLKKKKYAAFLLDDDGLYNENKMLYRGIVLARRDNANYLKDIYKKLLVYILSNDTTNKESYIKCYNIIFEYIKNLLKENIDPKELAIAVKLGDNYKSVNFRTNVFAKESERLGRPMQPGERMEYIIAKDPITKTPLNPDKVKIDNLGLKMRNIIYFDKVVDHMDYYYYIVNLFQEPIDQLFSIAFPQTKNIYQIKGKGNEKDVSLQFPLKCFEKICKDKIKEIKKIEKDRFIKGEKINNLRLKNKEMVEIVELLENKIDFLS